MVSLVCSSAFPAVLEGLSVRNVLCGDGRASMRDFSQDCDIEQEVDRQTAPPLLALLNQYIVHACSEQ
jgi:hypothetical protein